MTLRQERWLAGLGMGTLLFAFTLLGGCGSNGGHPERHVQTSNATDVKFLAEMQPHHRSAIEMAELARNRAEHGEIGSLAVSIVAAQSTEIEEIKQLREQVGRTPAERASAGEKMHGSMSPRDLARLRSAKPFDRAFIELMVPHHQDAIQMSEAVLEMGDDPRTKALARRIIVAQSSEIARMSQWYRRWYGGPVPTAARARSHSMDHGGDRR